jgi:DNA-binding NtrC family response regulator
VSGSSTLSHISPPGGSEVARLLVIEQDSSSEITVAEASVVVVGRAEDAEVQLDDTLASRRHAQIAMKGGELTICDLGSHNGTRLNGRTIKGTRVLATGDVVTIGQTLIVVSALPARPASRSLHDAAALRLRLEEELERAAILERPLGVIALAARGPWPGPPQAHLDEALRRIDVAGRLDAHTLVVLALERDPAATLDLARTLVGRLSPTVLELRAGVASCPADGCQADALLGAAAAAVASAEPGAVVEAGAAALRLALGDRSLIVADPAMVRMYDLIRRVARSDLPVLICGETGTGKELAARAVHHFSPRAAGPTVALNCAAMPENLVESELFGYEKGAFTGAAASKRGLLESAERGTLFLDEVGELPLSVQAKLLRALDEKRVTRLGGLGERPIDIRIVAATNRRLDGEVAAGRFRQDLYFRLNAATVILPPLRERPREIALLARAFLDELDPRTPPIQISVAAMQALMRHPWPGNVRELGNVISLIVATGVEDTVEPWHLPERLTQESGAAAEPAPAPAAPPTPQFRAIADELRDLERRRMQQALDATNGVQRRAAELLQMPLRTFVWKLKRYGLTPRPR